uniref:Secreted protein n=1 Tax=Rhipicephalus zambeziensis TaxID=60191 RepID=A0A224YGF8_9ACAR
MLFLSVLRSVRHFLSCTAFIVPPQGHSIVVHNKSKQRRMFNTAGNECRHGVTNGCVYSYSYHVINLFCRHGLGVCFCCIHDFLRTRCESCTWL